MYLGNTAGGIWNPDTLDHGRIVLAHLYTKLPRLSKLLR
jgi:hypothetical protein